MARDGHYVSHNIQSAREYECKCRRCLVWVAQTRYEETIALLWQAFVFITTPSLIPFILQCVFIQLWTEGSSVLTVAMGHHIQCQWLYIGALSHQISINDEQCLKNSGNCVITYLHDKHVIRTLYSLFDSIERKIAPVFFIVVVVVVVKNCILFCKWKKNIHELTHS